MASGAVSASAYDQIKAAAATARAELSAARAQASVAQNATGYAVLLADSDGVVMETLAEPGQVVSAGQVVSGLPERDSAKRLSSFRKRCALPSAAKRRPRFMAMNNTRSPQRCACCLTPPMPRPARMKPATCWMALLANAPLGATVTLSIEDAKTEGQAMQVPLASLYDAGKGPGVWRISAQPAKVTWTPVKVLSVGEDAVQVTGGVKPGEKIVALGAHLLHEGEAVRLAKQNDASAAENQP